DGLLLAGIAPRLFDHRPAQLVLAHLYAGLLADFSEQEAQTNAPLGQLAIADLRLVLAPALIGEGPSGPLQALGNLRPKRLELGLDQALRQREIVSLVERVEHLALELGARDPGIFAGDARAHHLTQLGERVGR